MTKLTKKPRAPKGYNQLYGVPRAVDIHVGARLRLRRTLLGISQEKLGEAVGLTFQQIQKYERGTNRIGASRLYEFAVALDVSPGYFFEEMNAKTAATRGARIPADQLPETIDAKDPTVRRETMELVRAYYKISDPKVRTIIFSLAKAVAKIDD